VEENLDLFRRMRAGEFEDGARVLRARGDMASPNMKMRDPLLYRIRHLSHYRTGDDWCIYPMYDYAHPLSDQIEQITHSVCTLEFENNRDIYDWLLDNLVDEPRPHQYEFARLNLDYTVMSKRRLLQLVEEGRVEGWDDPRLPTIAGLRRRGITPAAIRAFADRIGVAKANSRVEMGLFESCVRDDLNPVAPRVLAVLRPLKLVITNYPEGQEEWLDAPSFPHDVPREGSRPLPFSRTLYIERTDFMEEPPKGFFRLAPGREVRLRHAYIITCTDVVKDADGEIIEVHATYDPETRSGATPAAGSAPGGKKRSQTAIQWVSAAHALPMSARLYDRLLRVPDPDAEGLSFLDALNPDSVEVVEGWIEPSVASDAADTRYQFERHGYFWRDPLKADGQGRLIFNRIIGLRDSWAKASASAATSGAGAEGTAGDGVDGRKVRAEKGARPAATAEGEAGGEGKARIPERSPELEARRAQYAEAYDLREDEAELLTREAHVADFFEATLAHTANARAVANWVTHELLPALGGRGAGETPLTPQALATLVTLVDEGTLTTAAARTLFAELLANGGDPVALVDSLGLRQVADAGALLPTVQAVLAANPEKVAQYRSGKTGLLGFFTGQVMRQSGGAANPKLVNDLLLQELAAE
jgi:glutaminyl-tRNA synthetase